MIYAGQLTETLNVYEVVEMQSPSGYKSEKENFKFTCKAHRMKNKDNYVMNGAELFHLSEPTFRLRKRDIKDTDIIEYNGEKFPLIIRTRPSERHLFSPNDKRVVAYAQLTQGNDVNEWTSHTLELKYMDNTRIPTHIQVVASSSKYGDYFTGGIGSTLVLDNLKLHYE